MSKANNVRIEFEKCTRLQRSFPAFSVASS